MANGFDTVCESAVKQSFIESPVGESRDCPDAGPLDVGDAFVHLFFVSTSQYTEQAFDADGRIIVDKWIPTTLWAADVRRYNEELAAFRALAPDARLFNIVVFFFFDTAPAGTSPLPHALGTSSSLSGIPDVHFVYFGSPLTDTMPPFPTAGSIAAAVTSLIGLQQLPGQTVPLPFSASIDAHNISGSDIQDLWRSTVSILGDTLGWRTINNNPLNLGLFTDNISFSDYLPVFGNRMRRTSRFWERLQDEGP